MERVFAAVLVMMIALVLLGFVLAHFAFALAILLVLGLFGHQLRRHGA
jgi:predicted membrane protein